MSRVVKLLLDRPLGRWCIKESNKYCDPMLKGALADMDSNLCIGKDIERSSNMTKKEKVTPWTHSTALVYLHSYGT
jgi:hypothetical protein